MFDLPMTMDEVWTQMAQLTAIIIFGSLTIVAVAKIATMTKEGLDGSKKEKE